MLSFSNAINNLANNCRYNLLTPQEFKNRKTVLNRCCFVKVCAVAAIVTSLALAVFSIFFLGPALAFLSIASCVTFAVLSYDVYVTTNNVKNILDQWIEEAYFTTLNSEKERIMHLVKGAIVLKPAIQLIFMMVS